MEEVITESTETLSAEDTAGMDELMNAFMGDGYQTETEEQDEAQDSNAEEKPQDPQEEQNTDTPETVEEQEEKPEEKPQEAEEKPQMFTVKVNKEEKQLTLQEMTAAAQKGMDYDRIRSQRDQLQAQVDELTAAKTAKDEYSPVIAQLEAIIKTSEQPVSLEDLALSLRKGIKRSQGMSDAEINATIRAEDAEFRIQTMNEQPKQSKAQERMERDLTEFRELYPDVEITNELVGELSEDIKAGSSMARAYQKNLDAKKDAEIADLRKQNEQLQTQLKAEEQNRKNFYASPGSQQDSGGSQKLSGMDEFMAALR